MKFCSLNPDPAMESRGNAQALHSRPQTWECRGSLNPRTPLSLSRYAWYRCFFSTLSVIPVRTRTASHSYPSQHVASLLEQPLRSLNSRRLRNEGPWYISRGFLEVLRGLKGEPKALDSRSFEAMPDCRQTEYKGSALCNWQ